MASLVAQTVKRLPAMRKTRVLSLGWEDPLEKETATHSSILAWKIPRTEEPSGLQSMGSQRVRHAWTYTYTQTHTHTFIYYCSVAQLCPTFCNPTDCSMPGLPVLHHLPKFAQVHVHCISDAIQPSHPLMPSSPFAFNLSQHRGFFQWVGCLHQVAKVLALQLHICLY